MTNSSDILPGTLDLLILKAASLGSLHGFGVMLRIQQISRGAFEVEQGAPIPGALPAGGKGHARHRNGAFPKTIGEPSTTD